MVLPLAGAVFASRRADDVRRGLGVGPATGRARRLALIALVVAAVVLGLAAAQPILERSATRRVRADAEVFVVFDVSRSMLARQDPGSATRLQRAKEEAISLREDLGNVRVGIASLTDRVLPHLFPSPDENSFRATAEQSIGIERPPPRGVLSQNATSLAALTTLATRRFFSPTADHRLIVVFTDGETRPLNEVDVASRLRRPPQIDTVFVHVWGEDERVFTRGVPEPEYEADPASRSALEQLAKATAGKVYPEQDLAGAAQESRELLGEGSFVDQEERRERWPLAPFLVATAFLPLGLLLVRRDR